MALLNSLAKKISSKRLKEIDLYFTHPMEIQEKVFNHLIQQGKDTQWGKKFGYSEIVTKGYSQFQKNVPINDYDGFKPYIEQIQKGEQYVLWNQKIKWFAKSSGTTSDKSKFIPISEENLQKCHYQSGKDLVSLYLNNYPHRELLNGKSLIIGGSQQINSDKDSFFYGDLSAVLMSNLPNWANYLRTPHISIALMSEWEEKILKMANSTILENVTSIAGVPSWTLVLIKKIFEITGKSNLMDIWPNLEAFFHGGVSFVPYKEQFQKFISSSHMNYMETYNASEGFFAMQNDPNSDDMLLMLDYGIFYEFIPIDEIDSISPRTITLSEIETGKNYAMVISTNSGLWRYLIGDTVTFTSKCPYKIKISGRTKHFINAFGEEVIIDNAEKALKCACDKTGALIREYTAAPIYMATNQKGSHQWLIEFEKEPDNFNLFSEILDSTLKEVNSDYEAKRYKNLSLDFPQIQIARQGVFYQWLKEKGKLGGQHKIPRLANHREYIDSLIETNNKMENQ